MEMESKKVPSLVSKDEDDDILDGRRSFVPSVDVKIRFQLKILGAWLKTSSSSSDGQTFSPLSSFSFLPFFLFRKLS